MKPTALGLPPELFGTPLLGICMISVVEAGFIFSGNVGTGILLGKDPATNQWSAPCAVGLTGIGAGFLMGASVKDILIFIYDENTMNAAKGEAGIRLAAQAEGTFGPIGRNLSTNIDWTSKGFSSTISIAYTKGAFAGFNVEGSVVGVRTKANTNFYGQQVSPNDILMYNRAKIPSDKVTMIDEVYAKLEALRQGSVAIATAHEEEKKAKALAAAEKAGEIANQDPDVVTVDLSSEMSKN